MELVFLVFIALVIIERNYHPRIGYVKDSELLILFYSLKGVRQRKIFKL